MRLLTKIFITCSLLFSCQLKGEEPSKRAYFPDLRCCNSMIFYYQVLNWMDIVFDPCEFVPIERSWFVDNLDYEDYMIIYDFFTPNGRINQIYERPLKKIESVDDVASFREWIDFNR